MVVVLIPLPVQEDSVLQHTCMLVTRYGMDVMIFSYMLVLHVLFRKVIVVYLVGVVPLVQVR